MCVSSVRGPTFTTFISYFLFNRPVTYKARQDKSGTQRLDTVRIALTVGPSNTVEILSFLQRGEVAKNHGDMRQKT